MEITIHNATNVRLAHTFKSNANSISLEIEAKGQKHTIVIYGLPERLTDRFAVFRDKNTQDFEDKE